MSSIPTHEPQVVLFDMDGVLFDTMPTHVRSWAETATHYGLTAKRDEFYLFEGMKGTQTIRELYIREKQEEPSPEFVDEVYRYKCTRFRAHGSCVAPIPGVERLVRYLSGRGVKIGVVTGSSRCNAEERIEKYFGDLITPRQIVTADDVEHGKPHPEPYLRGVDLFGTSKEEVFVVENAPLGVRSAVDAGLFTIAVTTGPIPEYTLRGEGADLVMPDMDALYVLWKHTYGHR